MRSLVWTVASFLILGTGAASAHGERTRRIRLVVTPIAVPLDAGFEVVVICSADAASDDVTDLATATVVSCSIDGVGAARGMPGSESYVTVSNTVHSSPYTVCVSGQAAFVNATADDLELVSDGPDCRSLSA